METVIDNRVQLAGALGLRSDVDDLFVGKVLGFPVGLKIIDPQGGALMLFQIRHWLTGKEAEGKTLVYGEEVTQLLQEKKISIECDDRIAWLTLNEAYTFLEEEFVMRVLNSVLQTFQDAGFVGDAELCHYCQKEKVATLSVSNGKVGQICATCLGEKEKKIPRSAGAAGEAVPIFLMTPFGAVIGAILWAGCWMLYEYLMSKIATDSVPIPRLVIVFAVAIIGLVAGLPIAGIIRLNRRRGKASSLWAAVLFAVGAVVFGEILFVAWLVWFWFGIFSLSVAAKILPQVYVGSGPFYLGMKILAGIICVVSASEISKPAAVNLKL